MYQVHKLATKINNRLEYVIITPELYTVGYFFTKETADLVCKLLNNSKEKPMTKLWVDDVRPMPSNYDCWAKNYEDAIITLQTGQVTEISLDHDLGDYQKTGYDIAKFIERGAMDGTLQKMRCKVHSMNPVGRINIKLALQNAYKAWMKCTK